MDHRTTHSDGNPTETIIAMERAALDRWGQGDPSGFLEISAPDVVYFDPFVGSRLDGHEALARHYEKLRGRIHIESYRLLNPQVQWVGDLAVLTFNYASWDATGDCSRWNCTEVYRRQGPSAPWEIIQTHWSQTFSPPA